MPAIGEPPPQLKSITWSPRTAAGLPLNCILLKYSPRHGPETIEPPVPPLPAGGFQFTLTAARPPCSKYSTRKLVAPASVTLALKRPLSWSRHWSMTSVLLTHSRTPSSLKTSKR